MNRSRAFSLVELLVTIGIVITLAGLAVTVAPGLIKLTKQQKCASNLRGIGIAMQQYSADNDGVVVFNVQANSGGTFVGSLLPYIAPDSKVVKGERPAGIFACPAGQALVSNGSQSDYGKNLNVNENPEKIGRTVYRIHSINPASEIIAMGDAVYRSISPLYENANLDFRHSGYANLLYFDGHVSAVPLKDVPITNGGIPWFPR